MRTLHTWWLGAAAAGTVLAGTVYFGCTLLARQTWSAGPSEAERLERLTTDFDAMARRQETLRHLAAEVVEGRLGLRDAADVVRLEDVRSPRHLRMHVEYLPGRTEEERYCRSVLGHVRALLEGDPRAPAALARLEGELDDLVQGRLGPPRRTVLGGRFLPPRPPEVLTLAPTAEQAKLGAAQ
jgi:hypothetical protein